MIDGMDIARKLYDANLTPGELCLQLLSAGKKVLPDFYRSDLQNELDRIWEKQKEYYPGILTAALKEELRGKKRDAVWAICANAFVWKETYTEWNNEESKNEQIEKEHKLEGIYSKRKGMRQKGKFAMEGKWFERKVIIGTIGYYITRNKHSNQ